MVAKSYQNLEIVGEPYAASGRMYVKVRTKAGSLKQVRWYSEREYAKMYGLPAEEAKEFNQRIALGFEKGYITIFKGDTYTWLDWFRQSNARYTNLWGWYIVSTEEIPADLPNDITPVRLDWEQVGEGDSLKPDHCVKKVVNELVHDPSPSTYQGEIGDKIARDVVIRKVIPIENQWGVSFFHVMEDGDGNSYTWSTKTVSLEEGMNYSLTGKVKAHNMYNDYIPTTALNYCKAVAI